MACGSRSGTGHPMRRKQLSVWEIADRQTEVNASMDDDLVVSVRPIPIVRDRWDLTHGDPSRSVGGDGHGDDRGDGLNNPE